MKTDVFPVGNRLTKTTAIKTIPIIFIKYCDIIKTNFDDKGTAFGKLELASKKDLTIVDDEFLFSDMLRYKASQKESELKSLVGASKNLSG